MRSVRLSNDTRDFVRRRAEEDFEKAYKAPKLDPVHLQQTTYLLERHPVLRYLEQLSKIHTAKGEPLETETSQHSDLHKALVNLEGYLEPYQVEEVQFISQEIRTHNNHASSYTVRLPAPMTLSGGKLIRSSRYYNENDKITIDVDKDLNEDYAELKAHINEVLNSRKDHEERKATYKEQVRGLVEAANTTKQLLTALPAAKEWLPESIKTKMAEEPEEREKPSEAFNKRLENVDLDERMLSRTVTAAKIVGSNE